MDSAYEYAPSPTHRSSSLIALPHQPSPGMAQRPPSPPRVSSSEARAAPERTPEGPVGAAEALGQGAAADEVVEIPRAPPRLGLLGDTRERVQTAWVEGDQAFVVDEENETEELDKLFGLCYDAQQLIKLSTSL